MRRRRPGRLERCPDPMRMRAAATCGAPAAILTAVMPVAATLRLIG